MEKESILQKYAEIGINSQNGLYEFLINNEEAKVGNKKYDLTKSNEVMEFMAPFLEALGFEVIVFILKKTKMLVVKNRFKIFIGF
ncbi:MAG: hypothetical protein V8R01_02530 [Bacilli bacterium]